MRLTEDQLSQIEARFKAQNKIKVHETEPRIVTSSEWKAKNLGPDHVRKVLRTAQKRSGGPNSGSPAILVRQLVQSHLERPVLEYKFHPKRKWRFDLAWPERLIAVEIDGGIWLPKAAHSGGTAHTRDMEKGNAAGLLGWRVFRFTPNQVKMRVALEFMKAVLMAESQN